MLLPLIALAFLPTSRSRLVNVTIDDAYGDERTGVAPVYAPGSWLEYSDDTSDGPVYGPLSRYDQWMEAYNQTLHCKSWPSEPEELEDFALFRTNASITFNGTAVYFYVARKFDTKMEMLFYLDGAPVPAAMYWVSPGRSSVSSPGYIFDLLAFGADQLSNGEHRLEFVLDSQSDADSCFDYAIYTMDDGTASGLDSESLLPNETASQPGGSSPGVSATAGTSAATSTAAVGISHAVPPRGLIIVAPLVGGVIAVIVFAWFYARWRQRNLRVQLEKSTGPRFEDSEKSKGALEKGDHIYVG